LNTSRTEAFSDGVFAVAITLLALEIKVPKVEGHDLAHALAQQWPSYASYLVSFFVIGVTWMNHHAIFEHLGRSDRAFMALNLFLLLWIVLIPWSTDLMAEYMREGGEGERVAALVYAGVQMGMGLGFGLLWTYASRDRRLLGVDLSDKEIRRRTHRFTVGTPLYILALVVALFSAPACLAIIGAVALYYAVPGAGMLRSPD
jgi:uncharacterized membrane protein